jgi:protein-tyrosine phosphatase
MPTKEKIDLHCHILPYVDDGAMTKEDSDALLDMFMDQEVSTICCTPHLRKDMFETSDEDVKKQLTRLKRRAKAKDLDVKFFLTREYHADALFLEHLKKRDLLCLGEDKTILIEFSHTHTKENIRNCVKRIKKFGYSPLIAHLERYPALYNDLEYVEKLIGLGAKVQVNAGSILGREGRRQALWARKLLKADLVHVVASDAHDTQYRPPELEKCSQYLEKKFGAEYANRLLYENPKKILT